MLDPSEHIPVSTLAEHQLEAQLETKVKSTIEKYGMFSHGDGILLAVSGGADSVALLHLMSRLRAGYNWRLAVAHLVHGIRKEEGRRDALLVAELAKSLDIPFHLKEVDLPAMRSKEGAGNLEALGRAERYRFFGGVAGRQGLNKVATAHTRDDQAETVLMRLLRGSGRRGLGGMPPMRQLTPQAPGRGSITLVRPLIEGSRDEIMVYLAEQGLEFRTDRTNFDTDRLRSWVRHSLLPGLRERTDNRLDQRLVRLADILRGEEAFLDRMIRKHLERIGGDGSLDCRSLLREDKAVQRRLVRLWIAAGSGGVRGVGYDHVEAALRLVTEGPPQGRLSLPGGWNLVRRYDALRLEKRGSGKARPSFYSYSLPRGGDVTVPEAGVRFEATRCVPSALPRPRDDLEALFDAASLPETLTVRNVRPGDRFQPLGMEGHRKVKDLFIDKKVPLPLRRAVPLLVAREEILWIPRYGRSQMARAGSQTTEILRVRLTPIGA